MVKPNILVIWDCVQFWDTFFSPLEVFWAIQLFSSSTFTYFLSFYLPLEWRHSWDDSPPIKTTGSVGDSAAQTPPVALKASANSRPLGMGTIKDVCLSGMNVCERDQVKFLSKLLPENASVHQWQWKGQARCPFHCVFVLEIVLGSHLGSFTYGIKTAQTHRHQNDGCLALSFKIPLSEVTDNRDKTSLPYFHTAIVLLKLYNPNSHGEANFR